MKRISVAIALAFFVSGCGSVANTDPDAMVVDNPDAMTGDAGDTNAPGAVTDLVATGNDRHAAAQVALSWTNPTDSDLAGVVILRSTAAVTDAPADNATYSVNDTIGASTVVFVGTGSSAADITVAGGNVYHYAAFAHDGSPNYSTSAAASTRPGEYYEATITVPAGGGAVTVTPDVQSASISLVGTAVDAGGSFTVDLQFNNDTDRIMFNQKLMITSVTGATLNNPDGAIAGVDLKYFGPEGLKPTVTSKMVQSVFTAAAGFSFDVALRLDAMVYRSHQDPGNQFSLMDTGQHTTVLGFLDGSNPQPLSFSTMSRDANYVYSTARYGSFVQKFDTTTATIVGELDVLPEPAGGATELNGLKVSPDGATLYVAAWDSTSTNMFFVRLETTGMTETGRLSLGAITTANTSAPARNFGVDWMANIAYVPVYGMNMMRVIDLSALTEVDTDGNAANGTTPVTFPADHECPNNVLVHPDDNRLFVTFGCPQNATLPTNDVIEMDRGDLSAFTLLPITTPAVGTSPNSVIGMDGKLHLSRVQYPDGTVGDADSFGVSIIDIDATPVLERLVPVLGSEVAGNNDIWQVATIPYTNLGYAAMADSGGIFVYDITTGVPVDADGDGANGHTNIDTGNTNGYGGALIVTPW